MEELFRSLDSLGASTKDAVERFMGDKELYAKYVREFPNDSNMSTLVTAMENKDYPEAIKAVHTMKGIVSNLGFTPLADAACDLLAELRDNNLEDALEAFSDVKKEYENFCATIKKA